MTRKQIEAIGLGPVDVGSMLFTLVEPHRGHEVAYNRWYERDHFYAGCLNGAYNFAGRRWVATREHKALRYPEGSPVAADPMAGSYLALYWILDGFHQEWNRWAYRELKQLHADGRMFEQRDHVHTLLYTRDWVAYRDADPVPAALALDHPYRGLAVVIGEAAASREETAAWYRDEHLPGALAGSSAAMCLAFRPMPLLVDAPGVEKSEGDDRRFCHLYFLDRDPVEVWQDDGFADHGDTLEAAGVGKVLWAGGFIPTIPGTDTYTDRLW
jgi:hypothetical protein